MRKVPRPEHPRPQFRREQWLNLNGVWEFQEDPGQSGEARRLFSMETKFESEIVVPFAPESELSGLAKKDFMPSVWYRRSFSLPEGWEGKRVLLHFGAVDYAATVWVNGEKIGNHRGGYTPFSFDITPALQGKPSHVLAVQVVDETRSGLQPTGKQSPRFHSYGCRYTRTTGIWQTVWLELVPAVRLEHFRLSPDLAGNTLHIEVAPVTTVHGNGPADAILKAVVRAEGKVVAEVEAQAAAPSTRLSVAIPQARAWSPQDPFLYDLELSLTSEAGTDNVHTYFGMRSLKLADGCLYLNGEPIFQRLILDQGFYPDGIYTAPSDEALRHDIELSLQAGFNGARLHEKVFEPRFLYWADRLGYLVWGEFPNWGLDHSNPEALERFLAEWLPVLQRDFNHPAIITWCPFNETPNNQNPELLRTVYRVTKAVDPTRPVVDTSGYVHVETDVYTVHSYEQDPAKFKEQFFGLEKGGAGWRNGFSNNAPHQPGQPYLVDEYGGVWWNPAQKDEKGWGYGARPESANEVLRRIRELTEVCLANPHMCGFCYTQLTDVEQEVNGLYTYFREAKFDPEIYRGIFSQPSALEERLRGRKKALPKS